jgi:hypothetical protein
VTKPLRTSLNSMRSFRQTNTESFGENDRFPRRAYDNQQDQCAGTPQELATATNPPDWRPWCRRLGVLMRYRVSI